MSYLAVKWLHILSATLLFGTGLGSAFHMLFASLSRDARLAALIVRQVVIADWVFTTPSVILQPLTGLYLAYLAGFALDSAWLIYSIGLYLLAGACWLPVVWMQIRMREMALQAASTGQPLPLRYWAYLRIWIVLGSSAFLALVVVFYLMVTKPL